MSRCLRLIMVVVLLLTGVATTSVFSACTFLKKTLGWVVSRPQLSLQEISLSKLSWQQVDLRISLQVYNPNDFTLTLNRLFYKLWVDERLIGQGSSQQGFTIAADTSTSLALPISLDPARSLAAFSQALGQGKKLQARWEATAYFASPVGEIKIPFSDQRPILPGGL